MNLLMKRERRRGEQLASTSQIDHPADTKRKKSAALLETTDNNPPTASAGFWACIHRGAHQIGGSCVELSYRGERILVDLGKPLDAEEADRRLLPKVVCTENLIRVDDVVESPKLAE
jgi:hypothetical protein